MYIIILPASFIGSDCIRSGKNSSVSGELMQSVEAEDLFETNIYPLLPSCRLIPRLFLYICRVIFHLCLVSL